MSGSLFFLGLSKASEDTLKVLWGVVVVVVVAAAAVALFCSMLLLIPSFIRFHLPIWHCFYGLAYISWHPDLGCL